VELVCASTALHHSAWMPWKRRQLYASRVRSGEPECGCRLDRICGPLFALCGIWRISL